RKKRRSPDRCRSGASRRRRILPAWQCSSPLRRATTSLLRPSGSMAVIGWLEQGRKRMKAIYFTGHGEAGLAELPEPALQPGHALIEVRASGLCHTDIDVLYGRYGTSAFPLVPGHEYAEIGRASCREGAGRRVVA